MISDLLRLIGLVLTVVASVSAPTHGQVPYIKAKIVYSSEDGFLYIRGFDEESPRLPTGIQGDSPRWSPDGTQIVFVCSCDGDSDIYVVKADGTGLRQLTDAPGIDVSPRWSPDGTRIVFESRRDTNYDIEGFETWRDSNSNVYVMNADGSCQRRLTDNPESDQSPVWSTDGSQIAFHSYRDGNSDIYVVNSDGTNERRLTHYEGYDGATEWAPNPQLAFVRDLDSYDFQYHMLSPDDLRVTQVTDDLVEFSSFQWLPDGNALYTVHLDMMYLNMFTGISTRISGWYPYELYDGYDIWVESIEPMPRQP